MSTWFAHIKASPQTLELVKDVFTSQLFEINDHEYGPMLTTENFEDCKTAADVRAEASELLATLNVALEFANPNFDGIQFLGVIEQIGSRFNHTVFAEPVRIAIRGSSAKITVTDASGMPIEIESPTRTFVERLAEVMVDDYRVREAALALKTKPISWGNLNIAYETVKGLMSPKQERSDWENLVSLGWISKKDSIRFWETAGHYRHGHPRKPISCSSLMSLDDADLLINNVFRELIDHLQPK